MKFRSTRGNESFSLDDALVRGLAPDGGLFIPERLPRFSSGDFDDAADVPDVARILLRPFFEESRLGDALGEIVDETFSFPLPLTALPADAGDVLALELFHGPTAAFKDVGAGFLAACFSRLEAGTERPLTILVATSGDTSGAVAAAFNGRPGIEVAVLYPEGRVSERQRRQLTCWGDNVLALSVQGSFDDCQALVKSAMTDPGLESRFRFSSANSINIGRLLPQCSYYAYASLERYRRTGRKPGFIVPTGNLGNGLACILARHMGLPVGEIVLATNANRLIPDYLAGADWQPRVSIQTLASAMDVGNPSNMERLTALVGDADALAGELRAIAVTDAEIERQIAIDYRDFGFAACPHTTTAMVAYRQLDFDARDASEWIVAATAHPAKFEQIVEPLIGAELPLPASLAEILARPMRFVSVPADKTALIDAMEAYFSP